MPILPWVNKYFFPHDKKKEHFKALDGLRGIAVLMVLLSHTSNSSWFFHENLNFQRIGKLGVYLFFVLSAYLLDRQIIKTYLSGNADKKYWMNYFLRRFLRIYPLFILALFVHISLPYFGFHIGFKLADVIPHILLQKGKSIFWSIPVEFKYYFLSPVIMYICHLYKWNIKFVTIIFLSLIGTSILIENWYGLTLLSTFRYFPIFLVGTLISVYEVLNEHGRINLKYFLLNKKYFDVLGLFSLILIIISFPFYFNALFNFQVKFHSPSFYLPYGILWGVLLISVKNSKGFLRKIFEVKFLRFIGTISFSMYLFHMPILSLVKNLIIPSYRIWVFFIACILVSSITYLLIERPLSRVRISR